jgi:hypothetical protein
MATRRGDDAQVQPTETTGYGSTAQWTHTADHDPADQDDARECAQGGASTDRECPAVSDEGST